MQIWAISCSDGSRISPLYLWHFGKMQYCYDSKMVHAVKKCIWTKYDKKHEWHFQQSLGKVNNSEVENKLKRFGFTSNICRPVFLKFIQATFSKDQVNRLLVILRLNLKWHTNGLAIMAQALLSSPGPFFSFSTDVKD